MKYSEKEKNVPIGLFRLELGCYQAFLFFYVYSFEEPLGKSIFLYFS